MIGERFRWLLGAVLAAGGAAGGLVVQLLGGLDAALWGLLWLIILDYATGWLHAAAQRRLDSKVGIRGIIKKIGYLVAVMVACLFDRVMGMQAPLARTVVILFLVANEGLSILEHLALLGVPVPKWLLLRLAKLRDEQNAGPGSMVTAGGGGSTEAKA